MNSIKDKIQKEILENGLQVWHCNPNNSNNKVSIRLIIGAGTNQVSMAQNALPHLVEHVVFDFLEAGEASKIYYSLKDNNGYINANTNYDITTFVADIKEAQINTVIDLIKLFLINPNLHKENIDKEKDIVLNEIENNRVHFYYKLFQKSLKRNSLYYSPTGTKTSLKRNCTRQKLFRKMHILQFCV